MDIDLEHCVMSEVFSETGGFPYSTIDQINNRVLMAKVNKDGSSIEEYNTKQDKSKTKWVKYDDEIMLVKL